MNKLPEDVERRLYEFTRWHTQDEAGYKKLQQFLFEEIKQAREEERQFFADEIIDGFDKKYQEICSKHKIKRETPNTLFHDIIKEKINE